MPPKNLLSYFKKGQKAEPEVKVPSPKQRSPKAKKQEAEQVSPRVAKKENREKVKERSPKREKLPSPKAKERQEKAETPKEKKAGEKRKRDATPEKAKKAPKTETPDRKPKAANTTPVTDKKAAKKPAPKLDKDGNEIKKRPFYGRAGYDNSALDKGSKPSPIGDDTCLDGLTFLVTGRLESMDRGDCETLIKKHGGAVRTGVTKKLSYLVVGAEPGESKIAKANELGTNKLAEDELIKLIVEKSEAKGVDAWAHRTDVDRDVWGGKPVESSGETAMDVDDADVDMISVGTPPEEEIKPTRRAPPTIVPAAAKQQRTTPARQPAKVDVPTSTLKPLAHDAEAALWADKYAPQTSNKVLGNSVKVGELKAWLNSWESMAKRFNPKEKTEWKSGVLISGPPGIGKTTTALLVGRECGYEVVEFNASDQRSQKSLAERVSIALGNKSITSMFSKAPDKKVLMVMDEIGGLDRGGTTEIISMLKKAKSPIICICNDKYAQKLKSLANHMKDMPFQRPAKNQVAAHLKKLLREHEGVDLHEQALTEAVEAAGNDLRSTLNNLQMWCRTANRMSYDAIKSAQNSAMKNADLSPFQSAQRLFSGNHPWEVVRAMFFENDLLGLFMQENYIHSGGMMGTARIETMAGASNAIATADLYDTTIRKENKWSLGSAAAWNASYYPMKLLGRHQLHSYLPPAARQHLPQFPGYLGKQSTKNKNLRLAAGIAREVNSVEESMQGTMTNVSLEYVPVLRNKVENLLTEDSPQDAANMLARYKMCKLDWDFVQEIDTFKKMRRPTKHPEMASKTKSAMTRALNKVVDSATVRGRRGNTVATDTQATTDDEDSDAGSDEVPAVKKAGKKAASKAAAKPGAKRTRKAATETKAPAKRKPKQSTK